MAKKLQIRCLFKLFHNFHALKNINLDLKQGNMLAVLGPSGCGKTTLLRCIAGFETPEKGSISIDGQSVFNQKANLKPENRRVGYVPQDGILFPHLTVSQNINFGLSGKKFNYYRVDEMLELVEMEGLGKRMPHQLSGGQQQRVALARALAPSPKLILLDEPFSALDKGLRATLREDIKNILKKKGATSIIVTHDQEEALSVADFITVMNQGSCIQTADPVSLYKYPANINVATFVGNATVLKAEVRNGFIKSPLGNLSVAKGCPKNFESANVMIRPEQFIIDKTNHQLGGYVIKSVFYGHDTLIYLKLDDKFGGNKIQVRVMGPPKFSSGDYIGLQIKGDVMAYSHEKVPV